MSQLSKNAIVAALLLFITGQLLAQRPLTNSRESSYYTYIYQLSPANVLDLYKYPKKGLDETILHHPIDSFRTGTKWENKLPPGNYVKVGAQKDRLKYELIENHNAFIEIQTDQLDKAFIVVDKHGVVTTNAEVWANRKRLSADNKGSAYHFSSSKDTSIIQVDHLGVSNFFYGSRRRYYYYGPKQNNSFLSRLLKPVKGFFAKKPVNRYNNNIQKKYDGFIVFNKPKYKPHDTVKFKAFIVNTGSKRPVDNEKLTIKLSKRNDLDHETLLGDISSYRAGAFEYSFVLNDSVKMELDRDYEVNLYKYVAKKKNDDDDDDVKRKKILLTGEFRYEEYELRSIRLDMRAVKKEQLKGEEQAIYLKATDENDLPVPDGRANITITTGRYNIRNFRADHAFIDDTLWQHTIKLDPIGETKLALPDSIFPAADVTYNINAELLNSSNEHVSKTITVNYRSGKYYLSADRSNDTLKIKYQSNGKEITAPAMIRTVNINGDTTSATGITLPTGIKISPAVKSYIIRTDSNRIDYTLNAHRYNISLSADRTADSLFVKVDNPAKVHFWYSVFANNSLIDEGQADQLFYRKAYSEDKRITFVINYIWGGEDVSQTAAVIYRKDLLNIVVKQPVSVYPGQQVRTDIVVTDASGKPVANADITAWSLTRKFDNYSAPNLPNLGKTYPNFDPSVLYERHAASLTPSVPLNWDRWKIAMGLDSIVYYQFIHTKSVFRAEETGPDTVTQIAPFIVNEKGIVPTYILYIDERPVYFNQAQQLQPYSFAVSPGRHSLRFRTADRNIKLDTIWVTASKKLILGLNEAYAHSTKLSDTLSEYESQLINKYMITVENNFQQHRAEVVQQDRIYFLNPRPSPYPNRFLTGPLVSNIAAFNLQGQKTVNFITEGGYSYYFQPGFLKQTSVPGYPFQKPLKNTNPANNFKQYVLTQARADSMFQNAVDSNAYFTGFFNNEQSNAKLTGMLTIERVVESNEKPLLIKSIFIFRYDNPDFVWGLPGNATSFNNLPQGRYRLFFLLKGDTYDIKEDIVVKSFGTNFYRFPVSSTHKRDSVSIKMANVVNNRPGFGYNPNDNQIFNDALKLKEAFNEKYLDLNFNGTITGTVTDEQGEPVIGAIVKIKGTNVLTATDINGNFKISAPSNGKLTIQSLGYRPQELNIVENGHVMVKLHEDNKELQEVTVVGYGTMERRDILATPGNKFEEKALAYSEVRLSSLAGKVAGLNVTPTGNGQIAFQLRGNSSIGAGSGNALIVIDGVPVQTNIADLNLDDIASFDVLNASSATALYGASAANGVIIISTKKKQNADKQQPAMQTDTGSGIRKNFSDYAYWQPKLRTDANGITSFIATFPDDITNWRTFVIGATDDRQIGLAEHQVRSFKPLSATFLSPAFAVEGDEMDVLGKVTNYTADPVQVNRTFLFNSTKVKDGQLTVKNAQIDTFKVNIPKTDSVRFEYTIKRDNGYFDGERHKIPVIEQGVKETKGSFAALEGDTTLTMQFDPALGPVTLHAEASILPVLAEEAEKLRDYKYLCNEQLASKLIGLLTEKRIKTFLGQSFGFEKNIKEIIKKLQDNRNAQGTWGWWKDTEEELWITLHVYEALNNARKQGYNVDLDDLKLSDHVVYKLESYINEEKLACLQLISEIKVGADVNRYIASVQKYLNAQTHPSQYDLLRLLYIRQQAGQQISVDSLINSSKHTLLGNIYWGENNMYLLDNSVQVSLIAYNIIKADGRHADLLAKIRGYLLEQRGAGQWRNTYESSMILGTILPDVLNSDKHVRPVSLTVGGSAQSITQFPYTSTISAGPVKISKTGTLPVYMTGYQQFINHDPQKVNKEFIVDTWFEKNGNKISKLKGGEAVVMKAEVEVTGDADRVMIELPIPAGCSYDTKEQAYVNNEVHREYFKEKVSIFCRSLPVGKYQFTVHLMPRYSGTYNLNPGKAEMMYFPVFYGREGMKKVIIAGF